jgi:hypothetical protein
VQMATQPEDKHRKNQSAKMGDRATAPTPLEDSSDAAWNEFLLLQSQNSSVGGNTLPGPAVASGRAAPKVTREPITSVSTMLLARHANRTCPLPRRWAEMHALLPAKGGQVAPPPVQEDEWSRVSSIQKRLRLRDQIEWASAAGSLEVVHQFLSALPESDWDHF